MAAPPPTARECELASPTANDPFPGECGRFDAPELKRKRIAGGEAVARGEVPWQAQINLCGATIIDDLHLVTSASCNVQVGTKVYAGHITTDGISMATDVECTQQERTIVSVSNHPCYCPGNTDL